MRQWLADSGETFHTLRKIRRKLLQETDRLASLPLHERLWNGHLYWLVKFVSIEGASTLRCTARLFIRWYCRTADRILGGDRYRRYYEARQRYAQECLAKVRTLEKQRQHREADLFKWRLQREARTNPSFVTPKRTIH